MDFKVADAEFLGFRLTRILVFRNTMKIQNLTGNYFLFFSLDSGIIKFFNQFENINYFGLNLP